jgi:hypothetical protein
MHIECKIIELIEDEIFSSENKILIANISIIESLGFSNLIETFTFVFSKNSNIAKEISSNPTNSFFINLNEYTIRKIEFENVQNDFAYFHKPLLKNINSYKSKQKIEENTTSDSLSECLFSCHLDMFLYSLYYYVSSTEFKGLNYVDNREIILKRYNDVISVILKINFNLSYDSFKKLLYNEINDIKEKYGNVINYAQYFEKSISYFINSNSEASEISKNIYNDKKYVYTNYIQNTAIKAFEICEKRFYVHRNSTELFAHEFSFSNERIEIKIFPTPYSFVETKIVDEAFRNKEIEGELISYLEKKNILKIVNQDITDKLKTKWLFNVKGIISFFYVDRRNSLSFCEFGKQNRSQILNGLFNKGQLNFSISKDINKQSA